MMWARSLREYSPSWRGRYSGKEQQDDGHVAASGGSRASVIVRLA